MTAIVFVIALVAAFAHWRLAEIGWLIDGTNLTIYVAAFIATLAAASTAAVVSRQQRAIVGAVVLVINFAGSHFAWQTDNPLLWSACNDLVTAAVFILYGDTRWELTIGGLCLVSVLAAVMATFGVIPDHLTRDNSWFIAWSYPDIEALLGHACNIALGIGAGDMGRRIRVTAALRPVVLDYRGGLFARLRLGEKSKKAPT